MNGATPEPQPPKGDFELPLGALEDRDTQEGIRTLEEERGPDSRQKIEEALRVIEETRRLSDAEQEAETARLAKLETDGLLLDDGKTMLLSPEELAKAKKMRERMAGPTGTLNRTLNRIENALKGATMKVGELSPGKPEQKKPPPEQMKVQGTPAEIRGQLQKLWDTLAARPMEDQEEKTLYRKLAKAGDYDKLKEDDREKLYEIERLPAKEEYDRMKRGELPWNMNAVWQAMQETRRGTFTLPEEKPAEKADGIVPTVIVAGAAGVAAAEATRSTDEESFEDREVHEDYANTVVTDIVQHGKELLTPERIAEFTADMEKPGYVRGADVRTLEDARDRLARADLETALTQILPEAGWKPEEAVPYLFTTGRAEEARKKYLQFFDLLIDAVKEKERALLGPDPEGAADTFSPQTKARLEGRAEPVVVPVETTATAPTPPPEKKPEERGESSEAIRDRVVGALDAAKDALSAQIRSSKDDGWLRRERQDIALKLKRLTDQKMMPMQFLRAISEDFPSTALTREEAGRLTDERLAKDVRAAFTENIGELLNEIDALLPAKTEQKPKQKQEARKEKSGQVGPEIPKQAIELEPIPDDPKILERIESALASRRRGMRRNARAEQLSDYREIKQKLETASNEVIVNTLSGLIGKETITLSFETIGRYRAELIKEMDELIGETETREKNETLLTEIDRRLAALQEERIRFTLQNRPAVDTFRETLKKFKNAGPEETRAYLMNLPPDGVTGTPLALTEQELAPLSPDDLNEVRRRLIEDHQELLEAARDTRMTIEETPHEAKKEVPLKKRRTIMNREIQQHLNPRPAIVLPENLTVEQADDIKRYLTDFKDKKIERELALGLIKESLERE